MTKEKERGPNGRPPTFKISMIKTAKMISSLGGTDDDLAQALEVSRRTILRWKHAHPKFCRALKIGKKSADDRVVSGLYKRAVGFNREATKVFIDQLGNEIIVKYDEEVIPDVMAAKVWLYNRRPDKWRDQRHTEIGGELEVKDTSAASMILSRLDEIAERSGETSEPSSEGTESDNHESD